MKLLTWGIYLVVLCLPLYLMRFKVFGVPTTVLELMIYALFILWAIKRLTRNTNYKIRATKSLFIAITLILVGVTLATVFSSDLRTSAGIWKAWFVDPLLFFIVVIASIKNQEQIKKVLYSLFLSGTVVSVISLIYLIQGKLDSVGRLQAFYNSPNYLAMYLAPVLIVGLGFLIKSFYSDYSHEDTLVPPASGLARPRLARSPKATTVPARLQMVFLASNPRFIIASLSFVFCLLSLFFTYSFGAWLGIIIAVGFGLVIYLLKFKKRLAWIVLCSVLIVVLFLGYFALTQREQSFNARLIIWQKTLEIFKAHPIFGIGPGTFGNYFLSYPEWGVPQPHNLYLAFLLQTGILGFIGFIWLLIWFFRAGFKCQASSVNCQLLIVISIMVYILVHGLIDTTYWKNDLSVIFWLVIALMAVLEYKKFR